MKRSGGNHVPRNFDELIERRSPWLSGDGPQAGMVLSTRMRLARNLQSVPFTHRARDEQLQGVMMSVTAAAERAYTDRRMSAGAQAEAAAADEAAGAKHLGAIPERPRRPRPSRAKKKETAS